MEVSFALRAELWPTTDLETYPWFATASDTPARITLKTM
jgi:hypothetical protein